jgi:hypothetical protein
MVKILNIFGDTYSGAAGKAGVFAKWKGRQYRRSYVIPANPNTTMQKAVRASFTNAVSFWHTLSSIQRLAFAYLATGLVMSGFNYLVSLWQKATSKALPTPTEPVEGIKQICSDHSTEQDTALTADNPFQLGDSPIQIGSLTYTPAGTDSNAMDAYVDLDMGDVRVPADIDNTSGAVGGGESIANDDQLVISYYSRGRHIVREVLYEVSGGLGKIPAAATIADALRTAFWPIDMGTATKPLVVEIYDKSLDTYTQIESLEILNIADPAEIYFDKTRPAAAESHVDYESYEAIETAKLEIVKADTSFITWRKYSESLGEIPTAQSAESAPYDWALSAPGYVSVIRAAQDAVLAAGHELVEMTPEA